MCTAALKRAAVCRNAVASRAGLPGRPASAAAEVSNGLGTLRCLCNHSPVGCACPALSITVSSRLGKAAIQRSSEAFELRPENLIATRLASPVSGLQHQNHRAVLSAFSLLLPFPTDLLRFRFFALSSGFVVCQVCRLRAECGDAATWGCQWAASTHACIGARLTGQVPPV
jgi:hypothetical protein